MPSYDDHDDLDISRPPPQEGDLTALDWVLCIFCSGIACIIGIVRLIQGKPGAGKMIGLSLLFAIIGIILRVMIEASLRH